MAFDLNVAAGKRDDVGGALTRLTGKFSGIPGTASSVTLFITDCIVTRRIKKLNLGLGKDAAFSLTAGQLGDPCAGLNPNADWIVYGEAPGKPPQMSSGVGFPADGKGHDDGDIDIKKRKKQKIDDLSASLKNIDVAIDALAGAELRELKEMAAKLKEHRKSMDQEKKKRENWYKDHFGN